MIAQASEADDHEQFLRTILESVSFQKAPTIRSLLLYLWKHRGETVSEYAIAIEALGRRPDFDTKTDATVRVHIARLRQKLKEFYETEAKGCPMVISIPRGGHDLEISFNRDPPTVALIPQPVATNRRNLFLIAGVALLAFISLAQLIQNRRLATSIDQQTAPAHRFWRRLIGNGKPAKLFLPTPVFFEWNVNSIKLRDPAVNDYTDLDSSSQLKALTSKLGPPRLMQNYTTIGDTMAALRLSQYLEKRGVPLAFGGTMELTTEALAENNVILMGTPWVTDKYAKQIQENFNFEYTEERTTDGFKYPIVNRNPRGQEPARFETQTQSEVRRVSFGLITVLPSKGNNTRILSLRERPPLPLVSFLTVPVSLELLDKVWKEVGAPEYFEVVVGAEFDSGNVLRTWPAAIRAIDVKTPAGQEQVNSSVFRTQ